MRNVQGGLSRCKLTLAKLVAAPIVFCSLFFSLKLNGSHLFD